MIWSAIPHSGQHALFSALEWCCFESNSPWSIAFLPNTKSALAIRFRVTVLVALVSPVSFGKHRAVASLQHLPPLQVEKPRPRSIVCGKA